MSHPEAGDRPGRDRGRCWSAAAFTMFRGEDTKTVTAHFPRTVSIYEGSDVRVLGVPVGTVDTVTPVRHRRGRDDDYDADVEIPADAEGRDHRAVGRRRPLRPADARLHRRRRAGRRRRSSTTDRTAVPLELDQIYASLDDLTVALGPKAPTRTARSPTCWRRPPRTSAARARSSTRPSRTSASSPRTLDNNKEELFGSAGELEGFIGTLAENDKTVRDFNDSLAAGVRRCSPASARSSPRR